MNCKNHPNKLATNKTHCLCADCMYLKTHGETKFESAKKKHIEKQNKKKNQPSAIKTTSIKKKKSYKIKITQKQININSEYIKTCIEIDNEREPICTGCGRYQSGDIKLSHSHIISREDCKRIGKTELIYDKNNITFHCMDFGEHIGCHRKWENPVRRVLLKDFERNLLYIKSISEELFKKIINK